MSADAAESLSQGLAGHAALESLELWNVGLEDAGALSIGRLAARDGGNGALCRLNLGRNLLLDPTKEEIETKADKERVRLQLY